MLFRIAIVLIVLWLLGMTFSYTVHGFIHILIISAVVIVVVHFTKSRKSR